MEIHRVANGPKAIMDETLREDTVCPLRCANRRRVCDDIRGFWRYEFDPVCKSYRSPEENDGV